MRAGDSGRGTCVAGLASAQISLLGILLHIVDWLKSSVRGWAPVVIDGTKATR